MAARPKRSLLLKASVRSLILWLENEWLQYNTEQLDVALVRSVTDLRSYNRSIDELKYPFGLMALARIETNNERGALSKRFQSIHTGTNIANGTARIQRLTPIKIGVGFTLRSNNMNHIIDFADMCISNTPGPTLVLQDNATGFNFECRVSIAPEFDIPQADGGEPGKPFTLETTFVINSWLGSYHDQGLIKDIKVAYKEGTGGRLVPIESDIDKGNLIDLDLATLNYMDIFDTSSPNYKGAQ